MGICLSSDTVTEAARQRQERATSGCVQVNIVLHEFIRLYSLSDGGSSSSSRRLVLQNREYLWDRRVMFVAPLSELLRLHRLPPNSETQESLSWAMERLGNPRPDVETRILTLIQRECNILVDERCSLATVSSPSSSSSSSSGQMGIAIYAGFRSDVLVPDDEVDEAEEELMSAVMGESLKEEAIKKLERFVVDGDDDREKCTVCMDDMEPEDRGARMQCGHGYHEECIVKWLEKRFSCPICRSELPSQNPVK